MFFLLDQLVCPREVEIQAAEETEPGLSGEECRDLLDEPLARGGDCDLRFEDVDSPGSAEGSPRPDEAEPFFLDPYLFP
jgi:hypothetical protein